MPDIFRFKQFNVDQSDCAMKINTDGVLLGALMIANQPETILDIGTGTGVIALMLAQRFADAKIDAVEIDTAAADTAKANFSNSPFSERMNVYPLGFEDFFVTNQDRKYDLIVSNPPFFINSLKSPEAKKELAKHTDEDFFKKLIKTADKHLDFEGHFWIIIPVTIADFVFYLASENNLCLQKRINIKSFDDAAPHRVIACFGFEKMPTEISKLVIYKGPKIYSEDYINTLKDFFSIF